MARDYLKDPAAIYAQSFARIRAEAALDSLPPALVPLAVRMIHASGMVDIVADLAWSGDPAEAAREALAKGAPILCDANMLASGIIAGRFPGTRIVCRIGEASVADLAAAGATTRSAAQVEIWRGELAGAVVAIGNAPTALFRLLDLLDAGAPPPAAILAFPVGFVGAAESKEALIGAGLGIPYLTLRGRRGGSAIAAAAVNALTDAAA